MILSAVQNAKSGLAAFKLLDEAFGRYFEKQQSLLLIIPDISVNIDSIANKPAQNP